MKKSILAILVVCWMSAGYVCQAQKNEISVSYGINSTNGQKFSESAFEGLFTLFTLGLLKYHLENIKEPGPVFIAWKTYGRPRFGYGLSLGYLRVTYDVVSGTLWSNSQNRMHANYSAVTFAPEIEYKYLKKPSLDLYSSLGVGYTLISIPTESRDENISYPTDHFDFHFSPFGVRYGKDIAAFLELGIGYKGLVQFGISYKFGTVKEKSDANWN
jgi:hypothetical protein